MDTKPHISVKGVGRATMPPDIVNIAFHVLSLEPEYAKSVEALNKRVDTLRKRLEAVDIPPSDLKTTNFSVDSEYKTRRNAKQETEQVFVGWKARHDLRLQLPVDRERLNRALKAITSEEVQSNIRVSFEVSDADGLRAKILDAATRAARRNAETIAAATGCRLGPAIKIDYGWSELRIHSFSSDLIQMRQMAYEPDIEPEDVSGEDSVTIVFELLGE